VGLLLVGFATEATAQSATFSVIKGGASRDPILENDINNASSRILRVSQAQSVAIPFRVCFSSSSTSPKFSVVRAFTPITLTNGCYDHNITANVLNSATFRIGVPAANNNAIDEPDEVVTLTFSDDPDNARPAGVVEIDVSDTVTIRDDDPTLVTLSRTGTGAVSEGEAIEFTVNLGRALIAGEVIDVPLSIGGTGVTTADWSLARKSGGDLNTGVTLRDGGTATPKVRFSGAGAQTATLQLTPADDSDGAETYTVVLGPNTGTNGFNTSSFGTNVGGGARRGASTDFDVVVNPAPTVVTIARQGDAAVTEGASVVFRVTASAAVSANLTVNLRVGDFPSADFVSSGNQGNKTVTITSGATTADFTVSTEADTTDEPIGLVTVDLRNGTGYTVGSPSFALVNMNDDDATTVTLSVPDTTAAEGSSTNRATVRLSLGRQLLLTEELAIPLAFSGGVLGTDFSLSLSGSPAGVALSNGTVTFTGGITSATSADVLLSASEDDDGVDKTVTVSIPSVSTGTAPILTATNLGGGATGSRTGNGQIVLSDTTPTVSFAAASGRGDGHGERAGQPERQGGSQR